MPNNKNGAAHCPINNAVCLQPASLKVSDTPMEAIAAPGLEVKGNNKIDDLVVKAKSEYATQIAGASGMTYKIVSGSNAMAGIGIFNCI